MTVFHRAAVALVLIVLATLVAGGATALDTSSTTGGSGQLVRGAANPILRNNSAYDDLKTGPSTVVKVAPGDYRQWYEAVDLENGPRSGDFLAQTGYAVSSDGTSWTKKGIAFAPLPSPSWEKSEACPTSMHWDGTKWILFYHGGNNSGPRAIGRATSPTGTGSFTRSPDKPILERGAPGTWDQGFVADAKVIPPWDGPDNLWRLYYIGRPTTTGVGQVGLATSTDGITFTKVGGNPIVPFGKPGAWDDQNIQAFSAEWDRSLGVFRAWYVARSSAGGGGSAGYAWSSDGVNWTRAPENPVLKSVPGDNIEDSIDIYADDGRYRVVYGQYDLSASPPLRGKGEAFAEPGSPPPPPPSTDPATTAAFRITASADDGDVERGGASYPPGGATAADGGTSWRSVLVRRSKASSSYQPVRVGLLRFDTSSLPDDAAVVSAELRADVLGVKGTDGRSLVAEWYPSSAWPIDSGDWTLGDSSTAHAGTPLSAISAGASRSFSLQNLGAVNRTGSTALRLHISGSGSPPTGPNDLELASFDHATALEPQLIVQYTQPAPPPPDEVTTTIAAAASGDDGDVERGGVSYPPAQTTSTDGGSSWQSVSVRRSKASSSYQPVRVGLIRFDTSSLPDDATLMSAELRFHVSSVKGTDGRSLVAEWYPSSAWPIDDADWTLSDSSTAHAGTPLSSITAGTRSLALRNLGAVDLRGATALRLHVSGSASSPTGPNDLQLASFDHPTLGAPALVVTYRR